MTRLDLLNEQFCGNMAAKVRQINVDGTDYDEIVDLQPYFKNKLDYFNKQGWGYKDSTFAHDKKKDQVYFTGDKYLYSGYYLPEFWTWGKENVGIVFGDGFGILISAFLGFSSSSFFM